MIKVFLKHKLYEYCIDLIFDLVKKNFTIPISSRLGEGDIFSYIEMKDHFDNTTVKLHDVKLCSYQEVVFFGEKYKHCRFKSIKQERLMYTTIYMGELCDFIKKV